MSKLCSGSPVQNGSPILHHPLRKTFYCPQIMAQTYSSFETSKSHIHKNKRLERVYFKQARKLQDAQAES